MMPFGPSSSPGRSSFFVISLLSSAGFWSLGFATFASQRDATHALWIPPYRATNVSPPSSSLLGPLGEQPRLWLQGRSGMGKTSIFAAWERAYFASPDVTTLRAAARRHGFILVMLPVRHFAAVPPPDANKPETWILEAVRRRLEQFGLATEDLGLVKA